MGRKLKRINWWVRRRSHLPVIILGVGIVSLLVFNEETSLTKSRQFDARILQLQAQIKEATDSAQYYKKAKQELYTSRNQLEHVARENYNMQRSVEDVYIIK